MEKENENKNTRVRKSIPFRSHQDTSTSATIVYFNLTRDPYGELSNFWLLLTPIVYDGKEYATCEHLYQSLKYNYHMAPPASRQFAEEIRTVRGAINAKLLGEQVVVGRYSWQQAMAEKVIKYQNSGVRPRHDWHRVKLDAMRLALYLKFSKDSESREVLLGTGESRLIQHTKIDAYWGDGITGNGLNWMGVLLMETRKRLRHQTIVHHRPALADPISHKGDQ